MKSHCYKRVSDGLFLPCVQDEDSEAVLAADFEIGHFIRERIVPRAVLYFTGEAIEDDDDDVSERQPSSVMKSNDALFPTFWLLFLLLF